jgi:cold shock CspA family protein
MGNTKGTIKRLVSDKGFGSSPLRTAKYFFHQSACVGHAVQLAARGPVGDLRPGSGPKGPRAENVTPA